jgi:hypothetical protein
LLRDSQRETQDSKAVQQEAMFFVPAQTQRTLVRRLSPENKGALPFIPCKQVTEARSKV